MKQLLSIAILAALTACSPQKRLDRIIKRNPGILQLRDTVVVRDTVVFTVPSVKVDTVFSIKNAKDTVYLKKDFIIVKTYIKGDSIYVEAKTDPITQTKIIEKKVPVVKYIARETKNHWLLPVLLIISALALFLVIKLNLNNQKQ